VQGKDAGVEADAVGDDEDETTGCSVPHAFLLLLLYS
jgi:hypothetical protein